MNTLQSWATTVIVVGGAVALIWKVLRGMLRRARKEAADLIVALQATSADFIGVKDELAKLGGRVDRLSDAMNEHIHDTWHPAKGVPQQPNGPRPRRTS